MNVSTHNAKRRTVLRFAIGVCALALLFLWWKNQSDVLPTIGGSEPPTRAALNLLQEGYDSVDSQDKGWQKLDAQNLTGWLSLFPEAPQTLENYQNSNPVRPAPERKTIVIQPLGNWNEQRELRVLKDYAEIFFQLPARLEKPLSLNSVENQARGSGATNRVGGKQYHSTSIINQILIPRVPRDAVLYFGVTNVDLYTDGLNFVFGQAALKERAGVYSLCRYRPEFWNAKPGPHDDKMALRRACQILNHETGHMFGITHCVFYRCSMNGSNSLEEADSAPIEFCPVCHSKLQWNIGFDAKKRFAELRDFFTAHGLADEAKLYKNLLGD
jgi:archaemetzincin